MTCNRQSRLPDLLLDPASAGDPHLKSCPACQQELRSLEEVSALLDSWTAPEPSAYFNQKLAVRLREEIAAPPATWWEQLRTRVQLNTGAHFRPALAGALALALLVGGGTAASVSGVLSPHHPQTSATVQDLQILDRNDQAVQEMDQLLDDNNGTVDQKADTPIS